MTHVTKSLILSIAIPGLVAAGCSDSDDPKDTGPDAMAPSPDAAPAPSPDAGSTPGSELAPPYTLTEIQLPGVDFFPEGIAVTADGSFFVGSLVQGTVVRLRPGQVVPEVLVAGGEPASRAVGGAVGMIADEDAGVLWVCDRGVDGMVATRLIGVSLDDGKVVVRHPFPDGQGLCNDVTLDPQGNVYATDSLQPRIVRVAAADKLTDDKAATWATDEAWAVGPGQFGLNGLDHVDGVIYVAHTQSNAGYRVPLADGGAAGDAVALTLDRTPNGLDGMKVAADGSLIFVEGYATQLTRIELDGDSGKLTVLANRFEGPTTFAFLGGSAWVVEGQLQHLFGPDPGTPALPFRVARVILDPSLVLEPQR